MTQPGGRCPECGGVGSKRAAYKPGCGISYLLCDACRGTGRTPEASEAKGAASALDADVRTYVDDDRGRLLPDPASAEKGGEGHGCVSRPATEIDILIEDRDHWKHTASDMQDQIAALEATIARLEGEQSAVRKVLYSAGFCGDGNLVQMVERALKESFDKGRGEAAEYSRILNHAASLFPADYEGTVPEMVARLEWENRRLATSEAEYICRYNAATDALAEWHKRADEAAAECARLRRLAKVCLLARDGETWPGPCHDCGGHDEHFPNCHQHLRALDELRAALTPPAAAEGKEKP